MSFAFRRGQVSQELIPAAWDLDIVLVEDLSGCGDQWVGRIAAVFSYISEWYTESEILGCVLVIEELAYSFEMRSQESHSGGTRRGYCTGRRSINLRWLFCDGEQWRISGSISKI